MSLSPSTRESSTGPKAVTVVRMGVPVEAPAAVAGCAAVPSESPRVNNSSGKARPSHACPVAALRAASLSEAAPASAKPVRSPFTSDRNTGTPAVDSPSANSCRVRVLPVPVAPATRA